MNFENLEKYYAMNNLKKTRYFQQGLQRLIKYKRLKAILIDHYDYLNTTDCNSDSKFIEDNKQEIQVWFNDKHEQEKPNWSDCYYIGNYIENQKQLNDEAICIIKSLPINLKNIYLCNRKGEENMAIYVDVKNEQGREIFFFFN